MMEKPDKSLNGKTNSKKLLNTVNLRNWEPSEELKQQIVKSWGLEKHNERPASDK
jgi:hypothetical protein